MTLWNPDLILEKTPARKAGVPGFWSSAGQKQHSNIAAQQAIRSPQQSDAANAAPPKATRTAAAANVVFIVFLLDEIEVSVRHLKQVFVEVALPVPSADQLRL